MTVRVPRHPIRSLQHRLQPLRGPNVSTTALKRQALKRYLRRDAVILEAGAHRGTDTIALARMFPLGRIHAFEPIRELYEQLRRNTAECPNVTTYPLALGEAETVESMWVGGSAEDGSSSLLAPKAHLDVYGDIRFDRTQAVHLTTISEWARREGVERIDGMWLDMQGYELTALKAAGPVLATTRAMILEISALELYDGSPLWPEVRGWLEGNGFRVRTESWHKSGVDGDALVVSVEA